MRLHVRFLFAQALKELLAGVVGFCCKMMTVSVAMVVAGQLILSLHANSHERSK